MQLPTPIVLTTRTASRYSNGVLGRVEAVLALR